MVPAGYIPKKWQALRVSFISMVLAKENALSTFMKKFIHTSTLDDLMTKFWL